MKPVEKFHACSICCCEPRIGCVFVGIINLVVGTMGIVSLYFIISRVSYEMRQLQGEKPSSEIEQELDSLAEYYWSILLAYGFPCVITFLVGLSLILATAKNNEYLLLISLLMTGMLIVASFSIGGILIFILNVEKILWIPLYSWGGLQLYFTWVLITFRSSNLNVLVI